MIHSELPKISIRRKLKRFIHSYSGCAAFVGCISLVWAILYKCVLVYIPAPCVWMAELGDLFYPIALSLIASCVFYFITIYLPFCSKRKKEEYRIRTWIQQLVYYGECLKKDICGNKDCSQIEFEAACNKDLMSPIDSEICDREQRRLQNWFDYFENHSYWVQVYMNQVLKYGDSIPPEILFEFEKYNQFDNFLSAVATYKQGYGKCPIYKNMSGFATIIWNRANSLIALDDMYVDGAKL